MTGQDRQTTQQREYGGRSAERRGEERIVTEEQDEKALFSLEDSNRREKEMCILQSREAGVT